MQIYVVLSSPSVAEPHVESRVVISAFFTTQLNGLQTSGYHVSAYTVLV